MNRYDHDFRRQTTFVQSIPVHKVGYATFALLAHWSLGFDHHEDDEVAKQFDLDGMREFWEIQFSEPMTCKAFGHALSVHLAAAREPTQGFEAHIRQALRKARNLEEPWFMEIPEPPPSNKLDHRVALRRLPGAPEFVQPDPPADGIDLSKLRVRPREAALWMFKNAMRKHLVPPSLAAYLASSAPIEDGPAAPASTAAVSEAPLEAPSAPKSLVNRGGRPKVYDWGGAGGFIAGYIDSHDPQTEADLKRALIEWFTSQGKEPDEREVSRFVKEAWKTMRN